VRPRRALAAALAAALAGAAAADPAATPPVAADDAIASLEALAKRSPASLLPRYLHGQATYWTVVGVPDDEHEALLDADGMLEVAKGSFSIEPLLVTPSGVQGWHESRTAQALDGGFRPIPEVVRVHPPLRLAIRVFAAGSTGRARVYASYRVENAGDAPMRGELRLAIRPLQVLPPWQSLNLRPVVAPIHALAFADGAVAVDGEPRVFPLEPPETFHAAPLDARGLADLLGPKPPTAPDAVRDERGLAMGVLRYPFALGAGESREVQLRIPFPGAPPGSVRPLRGEVESALHTTRATWSALLGRVGIELPPVARPYEWTLRTSLAAILIHRDGPRIQPGSRNYERSWIRDGALTSSALLQMGFDAEPAAFLRWYAPQQRDDGAIPCCSDARGPDFTPEHDAPGEFLFLVAEDWRFAHDRALLSEMWPHVIRAVAFLDGLRRQRLGPEWDAPEKRPFRGLLPESISHEGYAKRAVHSYWDDLFALRGLRDAAVVAAAMGDSERAAAWTALAAEFHRDLLASYAATMELHHLDRLPASVELGDFDPTSTAIWLATGGSPSDLPEPALERTFDLYVQELDQRRSGKLVRDAYSPYEIRIADALVRLGRRDDAARLLTFTLADRRPLAWNQWPEILWRDPAHAGLLGDLPHGWIASTWIHSLRTALVFERAGDRSLVLAAGVPAEWLEGGEPIRVKALPTQYGPIDYELWREGPRRLRMRVGGRVSIPPGGIALAPPVQGALFKIEVNGAPRAVSDPAALVLRELPAEVLLAN
jgi:hypothetical protein